MDSPEGVPSWMARIIVRGVSVTAQGSVERAETYIGQGIALDIGTEGTAEDVEPAHAVTTNSVRKTNSPCWSCRYGPNGSLWSQIFQTNSDFRA